MFQGETEFQVSGTQFAIFNDPKSCQVTSEWLGDVTIQPVDFTSPLQRLELSMLIQANFHILEETGNIKEKVVDDYLRANRITDILETIKKQGTHTFIASAKLGMVGLIIGRIHTPDQTALLLHDISTDGTDIHQLSVNIRRMHVRHDCDNIGIGTRMLGIMSDFARSRGIKLLTGEVVQESSNWFIKHGIYGQFVEMDRENGSKSVVYRCYLPIS
ncbi:MAG TPA: hypothetical protein VMR81_00690 [Patescibacteria group bacterium]|nr:hypothetical protein [Patescibacteria group bacterium]